MASYHFFTNVILQESPSTKKCLFGHNNIKFLVNRQGISADPDKVTADESTTEHFCPTTIFKDGEPAEKNFLLDLQQ